MTKQTEQYAFAERVTRAKVVVEVYGSSFTRPDGTVTERQAVRVRLDEDGVEYGQEVEIAPWSELTIGQALDMAMENLFAERKQGCH